MKVQHHVNGYWPRCRTVEIRENRLVCVLDDERRSYYLTDTYRYAPHSQFLNLKNDLDLVRFVCTWGPLYFVHENGRSEPVGEIETYWKFQRWLRAAARLVQALERSRSERESLLEFLNADRAWAGDDFLTDALNKLFSVPKDPEQWIPQASESLVRKVVPFCIESSLNVSATLRATRRGRRAEVTARWRVETLKDALEWMLWYDVFRERPLVFCRECGTSFQPRTAHLREFCSPECGHRVAARDYASRRRAAQKRLRPRKARRKR